MSTPEHLVIALDDDRPTLSSLERLLREHGHPVHTFDNRDDFFLAGPPDVPSCLLLDYELGSGVTGTDVRKEMHRRGWDMPTIFLTVHTNVPLVVQEMRGGADGFLTKPYDPQQLLQEIDRALEHSRSLIENRMKHNRALKRAATLTPREVEVLSLVVDGLLNKEIADRLGLALITVKCHRSRAMLKLGAKNPAELAKLAIEAGLVPAD